MLIYFEDCKTKKSVAVNPKYVVVVFEAEEADPDTNQVQKLTVINTSTGNVAVEDTLINVVGRINGELK